MNSQSLSQNAFSMSAIPIQNHNLNAPTDPSLCLHPYIPNPQELMMLRARAIKLMQYKAMYSQQSENLVKDEPGLKMEAITEKIEPNLKTEAEYDQSIQVKEDSTCSETNDAKVSIKEELEKMVRFFLANMDKNNQSVIDTARNYYQYDPNLLQVFDKLSIKYFSAKKCKEDIIRYILRKAFRSIRTVIMKEEKVPSKKATLILCKRYFSTQTAHLQDVDNIEDEEKFLESLMPFHKNSRNRTMNINFVLEIFTSASFCQAYERFLPEFNEIVVQENKQKEEKLVIFLRDCIEKNNFTKLASYNRLPWTDVWIEDAKNIAIAIMPGKRLVYNYKKPKN